VSLADFAFFPNLAYMVRLGLELDPYYPLLAAYFQRMCARKSILGSWPPHWLKSHGLPCLSRSVLPAASPTGRDSRAVAEAAATSAGAGVGTGPSFRRTNQAERCPLSAREAVATAAMGAGSADAVCPASSSSSSSSDHH